MKGWVRGVVVPAVQATLAAATPISLAWTAYTLRPAYRSDSPEAQAAAATRDVAQSALLLSILSVGTIGGTLAMLVRR